MHLYSKVQRRLRRRRLWRPLADRPTVSRKVDAHRGPAVPGATPAVAIVASSASTVSTSGRRPTAGPPSTTTPRRSPGGRPRPSECPGGRRRRRRRGMPPTVTPLAGHDAERRGTVGRNRCIRAATPTTMRDEGSITVASESPWSQKSFLRSVRFCFQFQSPDHLTCVRCVICAVKSSISAVKEATSAVSRSRVCLLVVSPVSHQPLSCPSQKWLLPRVAQ